MNDPQLYKIWRKYIDVPVYRSQSSEYNKEIKTLGLNPKKDPYKKVANKIKKLFSLVIKLEDKGFVHEQDWGSKKVTGKYIVMVSSEDLSSPFIDFTTRLKDVLYYQKHNGGALVQTIEKITKDILLRKPSISLSELKLVSELNNWASRKARFSNILLSVQGSSKVFESALFQVKSGKKISEKYISSPFGSFEHFKRIIKKDGIELYLPYLNGEKFFYALRVKDKIPAGEIRVLK